MFTEIKTMKQCPSRSTEPKYHLFSKLRSGLDMCCHIREFSFSPPSQILYFSNTFLSIYFFTCAILPRPSSCTWPAFDFIRNVCLFEDYRIRSDMNTNGHQLHQMQSQFDPYLQNISKKMSKPMSVYAINVKQVQTSPVCGIYLNYSA